MLFNTDIHTYMLFSLQKLDAKGRRLYEKKTILQEVCMYLYRAKPRGINKSVPESKVIALYTVLWICGYSIKAETFLAKQQIIWQYLYLSKGLKTQRKKGLFFKKKIYTGNFLCLTTPFPSLWNEHNLYAISSKAHLSGGLSAYRLYILKILIECKNDLLPFQKFCENWDLLITISARKLLMRSFHFLFESPRTFWLSFMETQADIAQLLISQFHCYGGKRKTCPVNAD